MTPRFQKLNDEDKKYLLETMKMYSDSAKTFTQLSVGALVLPIVFARQILAIDSKVPLSRDPLLIVTWGLFLVTIGLGMLYQYLAVKSLLADLWEEYSEASNWMIRDPGYVYGTMMFTFFLAAALFVIRALQLFGQVKPSS